MTATVVIVTWNGAHLLPACLDAVLPEGAPVLVVDNGSEDGTAELLAARYPSVRVLPSATNTGFAGGVALALAEVDTRYVVLLNNDAVVRPGWLAALLRPLEADDQLGAVCSKLLFADGRVQSAGGWLAADGYGRDRGFGDPDDGRWDLVGPVAYATGTAVAYRTEAVRSVGGIEPRYFLYYEDVELSWRLQLAGWHVRYEPTAVVVHEHSATTGAGSLRHTFYTERNRLAMLIVCATPALVLRMLLRFPLTTVSVARGESTAKAKVRVQAFFSLLRWLPELLRRRRAVMGGERRRTVQDRLLTR